MRILNIMLAQVRGGVETMSLRYHEAMQQAGIEVISIGHSEGALHELPAESFRPLNALVNHDPFVAWGLRRIAREFQPDLILTHGNRATGISLLPFLGTADKTVQVVHNFRHKNQMHRARAALCVSASVYQSVRTEYPEIPAYELANFGPLSVRTIKPAPTGIPVLGTLGRLHINKGIDIMIHALALLRQQGIAVRLKIAGDGPLMSELTTLAHSLAVDDLIEFCGWVEPVDYLAGLDLFVLPSRVEPFGLVVAESMAAGVPVIATAIDGPKEILRGGELGQLFGNEDPQALAAAIRATLSDWPGTLAKARAAQAYALSHFSLEAGKARLAAALRQIVQKPA